MTTNEPRRDAGYRGALPLRDDRLARPWIFTVAAIFALVLILSIAGIPSRFIPDPTPIPLPSVPAPSASAEESDEESPSPSESASASAEASPSGEGSGSASPSPTP